MHLWFFPPCICGLLGHAFRTVLSYNGELNTLPKLAQYAHNPVLLGPMRSYIRLLDTGYYHYKLRRLMVQTCHLLLKRPIGLAREQLAPKPHMSLPELSANFLSAFERRDYVSAAQLIPHIKIQYANVGLLNPTKAFQKEDLLAARQLLEMAVIVSIHAQSSQVEVERLLMQVKTFYDPALGLPASDNESKILGLYLLLCLVNDRVSEFYTELEHVENPEQDKYLCYPVRLERWLMEGAYDKAWKAVTDDSQFPAPEFSLLMRTSGNYLEATIRNEIALCVEAAYTSLPLASAKHLLYLKTDSELAEFVAKRESRGWRLSQQRLTFAPVAEVADESSSDTQHTLIDNLLNYAAKIEVII